MLMFLQDMFVVSVVPFMVLNKPLVLSLFTLSPRYGLLVLHLVIMIRLYLFTYLHMDVPYFFSMLMVS
jgi:hypothetical protein